MNAIKFPSGLSISRAKQRAKKLVKSQAFEKLSEALDSISNVEMDLPWALAMAQLDQDAPLTTSTLLITPHDIKKIMQTEPLLGYCGFGHRDHYHESFYEKYAGQSKGEYLEKFKTDREQLQNAVEQCHKCCLYLNHLQKIRATRYRLGSYGLKHDVETYLRALRTHGDRYVSNGAFICAAIHMGFKVIRKSDTSPNAWICASVRSDIIVWSNLYEKRDLLYPKELQIFEKLSHKIGIVR